MRRRMQLKEVNGIARTPDVDYILFLNSCRALAFSEICFRLNFYFVALGPLAGQYKTVFLFMINADRPAALRLFTVFVYLLEFRIEWFLGIIKMDTRAGDNLCQAEATLVF